jgi:tetratricopeptide (TPR) repeat protein
MKFVRLFTIIAGGVLFAASASALDNVKTVSGITISGKIILISWDKVEIEQGTSDKKTTKEVPSNQIATIFFDSGSPALKKALNNAKTEIAVKRQYAEGLKSLAKIKPDDLSAENLRQDYDFYLALATAKQALSGTGKIPEAGKSMLEFVKNNPESYHYLEACEVLGDLLLAVSSYPLAEEYYGKLAKAPWPDAKMKAGVLIGRAQLAQKKFAEAQKSFQAVIDNNAEGPLADSQRMTAMLGTASVLIAEKKADEAIKILGGIIEKGDADDAELMSHAYNALGTAYRQLGDANEAKLAFLHTDQLYAGVPDAHAEALANLAEIWEELHKPERAIEAKKMLEKLYKDSPWAKKNE